MLTGMSAHESGMLGLVHRGFGLADYRQHLGHQLREAGYETVLAGVQHELRPEELPLVYERVFPPGANHLDLQDDAAVAEHAARFLRETHARPFFLACGFFYPHREFPLHVREDVRGGLPIWLAEHEAIRADFARYREAVRIMDDAAGTVLRALEEAGLAEETLVIFTTDHGIAFPGAKCHLTDRGTGVALAIRPPGGAAVRQSDALVSHLDVLPTVFDYLGIPGIAGLRGKSLRPVIAGDSASHQTEVFAEINFHCAYEPARSIRTTRYKLIHYFTENSLPRPSNTDDSPAKALWLEQGGAVEPRARLQLYDLVQDPTERTNLAARLEYALIRDELLRALMAWMIQTHDPLLQGPVQAPTGAKVNTADSIHPAAGPFLPMEALR